MNTEQSVREDIRPAERKTRSAPDRDASSFDPAPTPVTQAAERTLPPLMTFSWGQAEHLDALSRDMFRRMQRDYASNVELGAALLQCKDPMQALDIYRGWAADRTDRFIADGSIFAEFWIKLWDPLRHFPQPPPNGGSNGAAGRDRQEPTAPD